MAITDQLNDSAGDLKQHFSGLLVWPPNVRGWINTLVVGLVFIGLVMLLKKIPYVGKVARVVPGVK